MKCVEVADAPVSIRGKIFPILPIKIKLQRELIAVIDLLESGTGDCRHGH